MPTGGADPLAIRTSSPERARFRRRTHSQQQRRSSRSRTSKRRPPACRNRRTAIQQQRPGADVRQGIARHPNPRISLKGEQHAVVRVRPLDTKGGHLPILSTRGEPRRGCARRSPKAVCARTRSSGSWNGRDTGLFTAGGRARTATSISGRRKREKSVLLSVLAGSEPDARVERRRRRVSAEHGRCRGTLLPWGGLRIRAQPVGDLRTRVFEDPFRRSRSPLLRSSLGLCPVGQAASVACTNGPARIDWCSCRAATLRVAPSSSAKDATTGSSPMR